MIDRNEHFGFQTLSLPWFSHVMPIFVALVALAMVVLTPVWAVRYYQQPFLGVLLEPNNIVSKITGKGWPAGQAGRCLAGAIDGGEWDGGG